MYKRLTNQLGSIVRIFVIFRWSEWESTNLPINLQLQVFICICFWLCSIPCGRCQRCLFGVQACHYYISYQNSETKFSGSNLFMNHPLFFNTLFACSAAWVFTRPTNTSIFLIPIPQVKWDISIFDVVLAPNARRIGNSSVRHHWPLARGSTTCEILYLRNKNKSYLHFGRRVISSTTNISPINKSLKFCHVMQSWQYILRAWESE